MHKLLGTEKLIGRFGDKAMAAVADHSKTILSLSDVSKIYGSQAAVANMDLQVNQGEIFGFLGPNGAGKTTTIKMILDIIRPSTGTVELFGSSVRNHPELRRRVGFLAGDMPLDSDLSGQRYLEFITNSYRVVDNRVRPEYQKRITELARRLEVDLHVQIGNYSRGNAQKIGLIAAMLHRPELLILDEPSSGFDPLMQEVFVELISEYHQAGGTVFISSHSLPEVQRLCQRVAFIREGTLIATVNMAEMARSAVKNVKITADTAILPTLTTVVAKLAGVQVTDRQASEMRLTYDGGIGKLIRLLASYDISDLTIEEPELEDVFKSFYEQPDSREPQA